jgi:lipopolysaccharide/colanic/teichoic acid biosynthesis glycosyltransferase
LKRIFDFVVSATLLVLLAPVLLLLGLSVRAVLGAPVLFRQERPGKNGELFTLIKFRTMRNASSSDGQPLSDAERLSPFGNFLRSTSLDELPELVNVLKGEMSLVGPRPLLKEYLPLYSDADRRRHDVRPGITGWAQINGRNAVSWKQKFALDVWYVDNQSFLLDLKILAITLRTVLTGEGVSEPGHATTRPFDGNV